MKQIIAVVVEGEKAVKTYGVSALRSVPYASVKYQFLKGTDGNQKRSEDELEDDSPSGVFSSYLRDVSGFMLKLLWDLLRNIL
jgi:hypothetical protein